jgi:hypothetical protein
MRLTIHLDVATLNANPTAATWSPAQVIEHLVLSTSPYLQSIETALLKAERTPGDPPVRYTLFGSVICKAAGPEGNAPAPKALHPRSTTIPITILEEWCRQQEQMLALLNRAAGIDLSRVRVKNPFVRIIPMNLADCFAILTAHTERHVGQIEVRLQNLRAMGK